MNSFREWINDYKAVVCLIIGFVLLLIVAPPLIIAKLYLKGCSKPNTPFSADNLILYFGSVLTFFGTVALGALALWQNRSFKIENEKSQNSLIDATEKLKIANEIIAQEYQKQVDISNKLLEMQKSNVMPIVFLIHAGINYDNSVIKLFFTFKIEKNTSLITTFEIPFFYKNESEYFNKINLLHRCPTNINKSKTVSFTNNLEEKLEFDYKDVTIEDVIENICIFTIWTIDIYNIRRKNTLTIKIDELLNFTTIKYGIEEVEI